jgi:hypothetical protein
MFREARLVHQIDNEGGDNLGGFEKRSRPIYWGLSLVNQATKKSGVKNFKT